MIQYYYYLLIINISNSLFNLHYDKCLTFNDDDDHCNDNNRNNNNYYYYIQCFN